MHSLDFRIRVQAFASDNFIRWRIHFAVLKDVLARVLVLVQAKSSNYVCSCYACTVKQAQALFINLCVGIYSGKKPNYHEYVREMYTHLNLIFFFKTYARPRKLEVNKLIIILRQLSCTRY